VSAPDNALCEIDYDGEPNWHSGFGLPHVSHIISQFNGQVNDIEVYYTHVCKQARVAGAKNLPITSSWQFPLQSCKLVYHE